ncbi:MAG: hypothetical protein Q7R47_01915 [Candidatus Diapherotrites archaeon]|nr:hypothetical protein [Candidatus Diapherotrites archaeon]
MTSSKRIQNDRKAQVSLEFLMITAAFLGVLGLWWSVGATVWSEGIWALDVQEGARFLGELEFRSSELEVLGNGSWFIVQVHPTHAWALSTTDQKIVLEITDGARSKRLERVTSMSFQSSVLDLSEILRVRVSREDDSLVVNADH